MFAGTCFRHAEYTIYFFSAYRNTSSCMAYAITKAGVRWFLDYYPMPVPLNLMALPVIAPKYIARSSTDCESTHWSPPCIQLVQQPFQQKSHLETCKQFLFFVQV